MLLRILAAAATLLLLTWGGCRLYVAVFVSDETKIRWVIEDAAEGFNTGDPSDCVADLAKDWRDEKTGLTRRDLQQVLFATFWSDRDPRTKELLWRVEVPEDLLTITLDEADENRAEVTCTLRFFRKHGESWKLDWAVAIEAEMRDDDGWKIARTRRMDVEGSQPR
ncbi:MAG: hypothetical protein O7B99_13325 [Planctomycetota bacterium]|nr:hypothetical protein [Planctomycetota bacterium]